MRRARRGILVALVGGLLSAFLAEGETGYVPAVETRTTEVHVELAVREGEGEALLVRHALPEGANYRLGSSRLNGEPIGDPRRDQEGRLYWRIPFVKRGDLSYTVEHQTPLGPLPEPELTLLVGGKEIPLQGSVRLRDYETAIPLKPRLVAGPVRRVTKGDRITLQLLRPATVERDGEILAHTESPGTVSVSLRPGENRLLVRAGEITEEVVVYRSGPPSRVRLERVQAVADGRTPLVYRLHFEDENGNPAAIDRATVASEPEPLDADADPLTSGYQVPVEVGTATLRLRPKTTPGAVTIDVLLGDVVKTLEDYVEGTQRPLYLVQGSVTVRLLPGMAWGGLARGYAETPLEGGYLQAAMDLTYTEGTLYRGLSRPEDPTGRFPLLGNEGESRLPLASDDGVAFRYDRGEISLGYGRIPRGYSALYLEKRGALSLRAHVGLVSRTRVVDRIRPDGSRVYTLSYPVRPGSEAVYLESGGRRERLVPLRDYALDALSGTLYFAYSLWPTDAALNPQTLVVEYAPLEAPRDRMAFGVSAGYHRGPMTVSAFVDTKTNGGDLTFGLETDYRDGDFGARMAYRRENGHDRITVSGEGRVEGYTASADLAYDGNLTGHARVTAELGDRARMALEHEGNNRLNETRVLYEHRWTEKWSTGLGLGYRWETPSLAGVARLGFEGDTTEFSLTHSQPFAGAARTSLRARHEWDPNLALRADLAYAWDRGLEGLLGMDQKVGNANLSLTYRLPNASGEGNRARFGIRTPLALDEHWDLDVNAGVSYDFDNGERLLGAGVGLRYREERLTGTLGVDGSVGNHGEKLAVRAGIAGSLDDRQVVSADVNFQALPEMRGRFTVAYAYRGETLQALTYHRYRTHPTPELEGEVALAWHPGMELQLRPSAAYRVRFADPAGNTYQIGLGANYYFTSLLGMGGGAYYIVQPGTGQRGLSFSVEGSLRVVDPVWLNVGYTFGGFEGLTLEARPGLYLRLDLFGGSDAEEERP